MSEAIRKLISETEALPRQELPGFWSWAANHPSVMNYRTKSEDRYNDDLRRAHFLEEIQKRDPEYYRSNPGLLRASTSDQMQSLKSPYEPYGSDHPMLNTMSWMQALPSAVMATGQMAANEIDRATGAKAVAYPGAYDNYAKSINTLVPAELVGKNNSRWRDLQDMRDAQASIPWQVVDPRYDDYRIASEYSKKATPMEGDRYLEAAKMPWYISKPLGTVMDMTLDPWFGGVKALNLARKGLHGAARRELIPEIGFGTMGWTVPPAMRALEGLTEGY